MGRLIDADELKSSLDNGSIVVDEEILGCDNVHEILVYLLKKVEAAVKEKIDELPTVDAVPVGQGVWKGYSRMQFMGLDDMGNPKYRDGKVYCCSECGRKSIIKTKYCPDCGQYMR